MCTGRTYSSTTLKPKLAISGSYSRRETPGYIDNILTGEEDVNDAVQQGGRVAMLWQPDPALTIKLSGVWQSVKSDDYGVLYEGMGGMPLAPGAAAAGRRADLCHPARVRPSKRLRKPAGGGGAAEVAPTVPAAAAAAARK